MHAALCELAGYARAVDDLGRPIAYTVLEEGTPVYDLHGERIGVVEHVLGDFSADIFDGVIVHTHPFPGRHLFADTDQISELHERGIVLSVDRGDLHEPSEKSEAKLSRAWDWITRQR